MANSNSGGAQWVPSVDADAEARQSLKQEILAVIKPYTQCEEQPPFSASELAVMAAICSKKTAITKTDLVSWICKTFSFYGRKAIDGYTLTQRYEDWMDTPAEVVVGFRECFDAWEAPLTEVRGCITAVSSGDEDQGLLHVPIKEGRVYLRKWLEPARKGVFPFLELPAELRNTIYEMTFSYSNLLIALRRPGISMEFHVLRREIDAYPLDNSWGLYEDGAVPSLPLPSHRKIFAPLLVNKQIYKEAMPVFYLVNRFWFSLTNGLSFLKSMPSSRVEHLTQVYLELTLGSRFYVPASFASAMESLSKVRKLKKLEIEIQKEDIWWNLSQPSRKVLGRTRPITTLNQLNGFYDLAVAASKAEELIFHGECKKFEEYITAEVAMLKSRGGKRVES